MLVQRWTVLAIYYTELRDLFWPFLEKAKEQTSGIMPSRDLFLKCLCTNRIPKDSIPFYAEAMAFKDEHIAFTVNDRGLFSNDQELKCNSALIYRGKQDLESNQINIVMVEQHKLPDYLIKTFTTGVALLARESCFEINSQTQFHYFALSPELFHFQTTFDEFDFISFEAFRHASLLLRGPYLDLFGFFSYPLYKMNALEPEPEVLESKPEVLESRPEVPEPDPEDLEFEFAGIEAPYLAEDITDEELFGFGLIKTKGRKAKKSQKERSPNSKPRGRKKTLKSDELETTDPATELPATPENVSIPNNVPDQDLTTTPAASEAADSPEATEVCEPSSINEPSPLSDKPEESQGANPNQSNGEIRHFGPLVHFGN
jgi:hypothetical protein